MLTIRPIDEPDVTALLNDGRFDGEVEGYIIMEGPTYLGHALFVMRQDVVCVLDSDVKEPLHLDAIVRACVAAGNSRGATRYAVNAEQPALAAWWAQQRGEGERPRAVDTLFGHC